MTACTPSERIRVLTLVTNFRIGGTERQVANLALGLDATHFDLHLACLQNYGELLADLQSLVVPRPEFRIGRLYGPRTAWQTVRLARYVKQHVIQIVHTYGFYPNVFAVAAAKCAGCIVVASIRDTGEILTAKQRYVQRLVCRLADCVLVNADAIRKTLVGQGYPAAKISVIRNGFLAKQSGSADKRALIRQELNVPPESRLVVVSSRLNHMKGIQYFLAAAAALAPRFPDVWFLVVGDGANRAELQSHARTLGIAHCTVFTGFRTDVQDLLQETTVSVLPSLSEGLSNSILESMAAGVPVVATRIGGNPELIEDGVSGKLVPPRDAAALSVAIGSLLDDTELAERLGRAARQRVAEMFSMDRSVGATQNLYRHLVEARDRP